MAKVVSADFLVGQMGVEAYTALSQEFLEWKNSGDEYSHVTFGKDSAYGHPKEAVSANLRHVHLIPYDEHDLDIWLKKHQRNSRKTSDRILVYTTGFYSEETYIFLEIFEAPNGHTNMCNDEITKELSELAERLRVNQ